MSGQMSLVNITQQVLDFMDHIILTEQMKKYHCLMLYEGLFISEIEF